MPDRTPVDPNDPYPEPIYDSASPRQTGSYDIVLLAQEYIGRHTEDRGNPESVISDLIREVRKLRSALQSAEDADQKAVNCQEHEPEMAPESCEHCFPSADTARLKRWDALGITPSEEMAAKTSLPPEE